MDAEKHLIAASTAAEWWTWSGSNAEWVSAIGSVGAVAVAIVFGVATLLNSRRSKDNQERSTLVAAEDQRTPPVAPLNVPEEPATKPEPSGPATASEEAVITSQLLGQLINRAIYAGAQQQQQRAHFSVTPAGGEVWRLTNFGEEAAFNLEIEGLTELDKRRLTNPGPTPADIGPGDSIEFTLVSRFSLSGPANVVVTYALNPGAPRARAVLLVPAP